MAFNLKKKKGPMGVKEAAQAFKAGLGAKKKKGGKKKLMPAKPQKQLPAPTY